jgi:hypothetical protein
LQANQVPFTRGRKISGGLPHNFGVCLVEIAVTAITGAL